MQNDLVLVLLGLCCVGLVVVQVITTLILANLGRRVRRLEEELALWTVGS